MKPYEHDMVRSVGNSCWWYRAFRQQVVASIEPDRENIVSAIREQKERSWWRKAGSWLTNRIADFVAEKSRQLYLCSLRCLSRFVVAEITKSRPPYPILS